jgi:hypothetical protein
MKDLGGCDSGSVLTFPDQKTPSLHNTFGALTTSALVAHFPFCYPVLFSFLLSQIFNTTKPQVVPSVLETNRFLEILVLCWFYM